MHIFAFCNFSHYIVLHAYVIVVVLGDLRKMLILADQSHRVLLV